MVRRWSFISKILKYSKICDNFLNSSKLTSFKSLVFLKKPFYGFTKYKRKFFINKKRKSYWLFYNHIFIKWSKEYFLIKNFFKWSFLFNLFNYNIISFNFSLFLNKNVLYNFNQSIFFFFVNKNYSFMNFKNLNTGFNFKNSHNLIIYTNKKKNLNRESLILNYTKNTISLLDNPKLGDFFYFFNNNFFFLLEIYSINVNLFYFKIFTK